MDGSTSRSTQLKWVLLSAGLKAILGPARGSFGSSFHKDPMTLGLAGSIRVGSSLSRTQASCYNECPMKEKEKKKLLDELLLSKASTWYQIPS